MAPLFETSCMGFTVTLHSGRLCYRPMGMGEQCIPLSQISSVAVAMPLMQTVTVTTTGGERIKMVVRLRDKKKLRDAIYEAMDSSK